MKKFLLIFSAWMLFITCSYASTNKEVLIFEDKENTTAEIKSINPATTIEYPAASIEMSKFEGAFSIELQKAVVLTWETNAINNDYTYTIERAIKNTFSEIGAINSVNTLDKKTLYFTDFTPLNGTSYYRIKASDGNTLKYSEIISVKNSSSIFIASPDSGRNK